MANFNFNGLTSPILPNIYISKVTLDGANSATNKIAANRQSAIEMHIDKRQEGGWTGNPKEDNYIDRSNLVVTYDLLLEVEEIYDDLENDLFSYIKVHVVTLKGDKGKDAYKHLIGSPDPNANNKFDLDGELNMGELIHGSGPIEGLENNGQWPSVFGTEMLPNINYKYTSQHLDSIVDNTFNTNQGQQDPISHLSIKQKRDLIKQKYQHILPNGDVIYKIPVRIKQEIQGDIFPKNLAAIAMCSLDIKGMVDDFDGQGNNISYEWANSYGKLATEVIISNNKIPKQGMMFFISSQQETEEFDDIMGTLWLGGVHKHNDKFMAGSKHDSNISHPFLDYVMVDNNRVHDFRQLTEVKKKILNFEFEKSVITGQNYISNQLFKNPSADFSNLACFGDLLHTTNIKRQTKLSFCIDWGKLIKKHCLLPGLVDKLSAMGMGQVVDEFFSLKSVPNILSFKVYRERVDATNDIVNDTGKKLIYDGYPNIYYTGEMSGAQLKQEQIVSYNPRLKSSLVPLKVKYAQGAQGFIGHVKHYTFTDYDIESISRGTYRYSLEVEITDPTLSFLVDLYSQVLSGINQIKPMVSFINGATGQELFNSSTGQFTETTKKIFDNQGWASYAQDTNTSINTALYSVIWFSAISDNPSTVSTADLRRLLDVNSGTPDSINVVNDMLISVADRVKSVVDSFSTASIPKIQAFSEGGIIEKINSGATVSATIPKKKIKVEHVFSKKTELIDTTHSDAGYEYLGGNMSLDNMTTAEIGFKSVMLNDYVGRGSQESRDYFPGPNFVQGINMPLSLPNLEQLIVYPNQQVGRYLRVPMGATHLPKYIVDHMSNNENDYWMVVNNILRYKMGLYGDSGADHRLGYGPDDKLDGSLQIDAQMERLLKEYQTLAHKGVYFPQSSMATPAAVTSATVTDATTAGDEDATGAQTAWESIQNNPLPQQAPLEKQKNTLDSEALIKLMKVPWAQNYGQEKLLLSLINASFLAPSVLDLKLGSFDTLLKGSKIEAYIRGIYDGTLQSAASFGYDPQNQAIAVVTNWLQSLPAHILVLLANLHTNTIGSLSMFGPDGTKLGNFTYYRDGGTPQLYELPAQSGQKNSGDGAGPVGGGEMLPIATKKDIQNQDLKVDKFGQFWFHHMNLVEVQYLAGYGTTAPASEYKPDYFLDDPDFSSKKGKKYEEVFNSSVKYPIWMPLNANEALQMLNLSDEEIGDQNHILCRIVKKEYDFFSKEVYKALDLPIYDKYFLITTEKQVGGPNSGVPRHNAYVEGFPTDTIPAGAPGLQMAENFLVSLARNKH